MNYKQLIKQLQSKQMHLSFSSLKAFGKSPRHFIEYKLKKFEPTPAMKFGTLVHAAILQPDKFDEDFLICSNEPSTDLQIGFANELIICHEKLKQEGQELNSDHVQEAYDLYYKKGDGMKLYGELKEYFDIIFSGKEIITVDQKNHCKMLREETWKNKASAALLNRITITEQKLKFKYKDWDIVFVPDGQGDDLFMDLKVTDSDPETLGRQIYKMQNYVQIAIYDMGLHALGKPKKERYILGVDKFGNISVNLVDQDYIHYGVRQFKKWVHDFERAILFKHFSKSYDFYGRKGIHGLKKPTFAREINDVGIE